MKRATMLVVILAVATFVSAQDKPPARQAAPAQSAPAQPRSGNDRPRRRRRPNLTPTKWLPPIPTRRPWRKRRTILPPSIPDSELRLLLYRAGMHAYQTANKADNMMEMGRKVLKIDPDDPEALVGVAQVLAERTRDSDLDKDQRLDEGSKMALHAVETTDTDITVPPGTPQDKIDEYKGFLRSTAYYVFGTIQYTREKYADAEGYFRKSIDAYPFSA